MLSRQPRGRGGVGGRGIHLRAGQPQSHNVRRQFEEFAAASVARKRSRSFPDFRPASADGLVFLPQDNLNTDGIYGKDYTYREDMTAGDDGARGDGKLRSAIC